MPDTRLDDAEAMRNLWDETDVLARDAQRLSEGARLLSVLTRRFAASYVFLPIEDPRALLVQLGGVLDLCDAIHRARANIEDAVRTLEFAFKPGLAANNTVQGAALKELKVRLAAHATATAAPPQKA